LGLSFMSMFVLEVVYGIVFGNIWYAIIFNLYPMFAAMSFIWIGRKLLKNAVKLSRVLTSLGAASFGIYLMHPALLSYWRTSIPNNTGGMLQYHTYTIGAFLLSLFLPWLLVSLYGLIVRKLKPPRRKIQPQRGTA
jgi:peptidoglycan/LPS O-acetylase OafA/YrhL